MFIMYTTVVSVRLHRLRSKYAPPQEHATGGPSTELNLRRSVRR